MVKNNQVILRHKNVDVDRLAEQILLVKNLPEQNAVVTGLANFLAKIHKQLTCEHLVLKPHRKIAFCEICRSSLTRVLVPSKTRRIPNA